jgi:FMN phosphatase YigB (HAD superfamily)
MHHEHRPKLLLDFGNVLTKPQDRGVFGPILRELALDPADFFKAWSRYRDGYDRGAIAPAAYWNKVLHDAGALDASAGVEPTLLQCLRELDLASYTIPRTAMHDLVQSLCGQGVPVGILSNMPPGIGRHWLAIWPWLDRLDCILWSGDEGLQKPDPAIYRLYLTRSGWSARTTLFVDDVLANVEAAAAMGFRTCHFVDEPAAMRTILEWVLPDGSQ